MERRAYRVVHKYVAYEAFIVEATSPDEAARFAADGDPSDPRVPGERIYDEYDHISEVKVHDEDTDELLLTI